MDSFSFHVRHSFFFGFTSLRLGQNELLYFRCKSLWQSNTFCLWVLERYWKCSTIQSNEWNTSILYSKKKKKSVRLSQRIIGWTDEVFINWMAGMWWVDIDEKIYFYAEIQQTPKILFSQKTCPREREIKTSKSSHNLLSNLFVHSVSLASICACTDTMRALPMHEYPIVCCAHLIA